jgi:menaquinone-dependent protoporphyrinogen oxidase
VTDVIEATSAREHRIFGGRIDRSALSFPERAVMMAVRAREGDYRDWDEIAAWADEIADAPS